MSWNVGWLIIVVSVCPVANLNFPRCHPLPLLFRKFSSGGGSVLGFTVASPAYDLNSDPAAFLGVSGVDFAVQVKYVHDYIVAPRLTHMWYNGTMNNNVSMQYMPRRWAHTSLYNNILGEPNYQYSKR